MIKLNWWKLLKLEILFVFWFGINSLCFDFLNYFFEKENDIIWCLNYFRKNVIMDEIIVILLLKKKDVLFVYKLFIRNLKYII